MKKFAIVFTLSVLATNAFGRDILCGASKFPETNFIIRVSDDPATLKTVGGKIFADVPAAVFGKTNPNTIVSDIKAQNEASVELMTDITARELIGEIRGRQTVVGKTAAGENVSVTLDILGILSSNSTRLNKDTVIKGNVRVRVITKVKTKDTSLETEQTQLSAMSCRNLSDFDLDTVLDGLNLKQ